MWLIQTDGPFPDIYEENLYVVASRDFGVLFTLETRYATLYATEKLANSAIRKLKISKKLHPEAINLESEQYALDNPTN